jgi:hypothetical protein
VVVEHRFSAVLEVLNGSPMVGVAMRCGASRQSILGVQTSGNTACSAW